MTVDKFARHISKRDKINNIDIEDLVKNVEKEISDNISNNLNYIENEVVDHFKYELQQNQLGISNFEKELKVQNKRSLENTENIGNVLKKLKLCEENIEKINIIMQTKIKEVVFFNAKEKIKGLKNDIDNFIAKKKEIVDSVYNNRQINELSLTERRIVIDISSSTKSIVTKLNDELNKIDKGMGELDAIVNPTSLNYLNTKIKDNLDDMSKKVDEINEYLKQQDNLSLSQKLKEWDGKYISYWDNYFHKS